MPGPARQRTGFALGRNGRVHDHGALGQGGIGVVADPGRIAVAHHIFRGGLLQGLAARIPAPTSDVPTGVWVLAIDAFDAVARRARGMASPVGVTELVHRGMGGVFVEEPNAESNLVRGTHVHRLRSDSEHAAGAAVSTKATLGTNQAEVVGVLADRVALALLADLVEELSQPLPLALTA